MNTSRWKIPMLPLRHIGKPLVCHSAMLGSLFVTSQTLILFLPCHSLLSFSMTSPLVILYRCWSKRLSCLVWSWTGVWIAEYAPIRSLLLPACYCLAVSRSSNVFILWSVFLMCLMLSVVFSSLFSLCSIFSPEPCRRIDWAVPEDPMTSACGRLKPYATRRWASKYIVLVLWTIPPSLSPLFAALLPQGVDMGWRCHWSLPTLLRALLVTYRDPFWPRIFFTKVTRSNRMQQARSDWSRSKRDWYTSSSRKIAQWLGRIPRSGSLSSTCDRRI